MNTIVGFPWRNSNSITNTKHEKKKKKRELIHCNTAFFLKRGAKRASLASQLWERHNVQHVNCEKNPFFVVRLLEGARVETSHAHPHLSCVSSVGRACRLQSGRSRGLFPGPDQYSGS